MTDATLEELRKLLIADEGVVLHAYPDSRGFLTIGCGRLIDPRRGGGITYTEALYLLDHDMDNCAAELSERFAWYEDQDPVRQVVLLSLCFNLGIDGLAKFTNTLAAFKRKDYEAAAKGLMASLWYSQVQRSRSDRLLAMTRTGKWPMAKA